MSLSLTGFTGLKGLKPARPLRTRLLQFRPEMFFQVDHSWNVASPRRQGVHRIKRGFEGGSRFVCAIGLQKNFPFARQPRFFPG